MNLWPFFKKTITFTVPGPSPWYLRPPTASLRTPAGVWKWAFYEGPPLAGLTRLITPQGATVLFLDFGCYVQQLSDDRILIWYEVNKSSDLKRLIVFTILSLQKLQAFEDPQTAASTMRKEKRRTSYRGGDPQLFEFVTAIEAGEHMLLTPAAFSGLKEQLVLADFGPGEALSNHYDKMFRAIFAFDFSRKRVLVFPQKWFNEGNYDFGYQWITRVQRDMDGSIIGEGIRLGVFQLDATATQIKAWLVEDVFYHPERG